MLTQVCQYLRNWFERETWTGTFTIRDGTILDDSGTPLPLAPAQYVRVIGSLFCDGVHQYGADTLSDETFSGAVWSMAVPSAVIDLAAEIAAWAEKYGKADSAAMSPFTAESFGGYSYSKNAGGMTGTGGGGSWQSVFADRLAPWRKI